MTVHENERGLDDYTVSVSEQELKALRKVVKKADGRKSEVKMAREALGL